MQSPAMEDEKLHEELRHWLTLLGAAMAAGPSALKAFISRLSAACPGHFLIEQARMILVRVEQAHDAYEKLLHDHESEPDGETDRSKHETPGG